MTHRAMPITSGTRLEPYESVAPLGVGGLGEVYVSGHQTAAITVVLNWTADAKR